jgi:hypothetical protein
MLPSMRHFLEFIDYYDTFNSHGFIKKVSASPPEGQKNIPEAARD